MKNPNKQIIGSVIILSTLFVIGIYINYLIFGAEAFPIEL